MEQQERSKQTILIVLGSLIFILGLSSLILFFQNRLLRQQIASTQTSPSPSPEASADPTTDWKTYTTSGYSFKHPSSWTVKIDGRHITISSEEQPEIGNYPYIHFNETDNPQKLSLEKFENTQEGKTANLYNPDAIEIEVANTTAFRQESGSCEPLTCDLVVIPYLDKFYIVSNVYSGNEKISKETFDQILSTFKFTSLTPPDPTSDEPENIGTYEGIPVQD